MLSSRYYLTYERHRYWGGGGCAAADPILLVFGCDCLLQRGEFPGCLGGLSLLCIINMGTEEALHHCA